MRAETRAHAKDKKPSPRTAVYPFDSPPPEPFDRAVGRESPLAGTVLDPQRPRATGAHRQERSRELRIGP